MQTEYRLPHNAIALRAQLQQQHNWQNSYRVLIQAAKERTPLAIEKRTDEYRVQGCEAKVWLSVEGTPDALHFAFYSEARMVDALIYAAMLPLQGQPAGYASMFNVQQWLSECRLNNHLSPSRSNGLHQVIRAAQRMAGTFTSAG